MPFLGIRMRKIHKKMYEKYVKSPYSDEMIQVFQMGKGWNTRERLKNKCKKCPLKLEGCPSA